MPQKLPPPRPNCFDRDSAEPKSEKGYKWGYHLPLFRGSPYPVTLGCSRSILATMTSILLLTIAACSTCAGVADLGFALTVTRDARQLRRRNSCTRKRDDTVPSGIPAYRSWVPNRGPHKHAALNPKQGGVLNSNGEPRRRLVFSATRTAADSPDSKANVPFKTLVRQ